MLAILHALGMLVADVFKSRSRLEAENLFLRHQLKVALRRAPHRRLRVRGPDRAFLLWMIWLWPSLIDAVKVVQPETVLRLASEPSGDGNRGTGQGGRRLIASFAI